jgi:hypothetical protein
MRESRISRLSLQLLTLDLFLAPVGLLFATWLPLGRGGALPEEVVGLRWHIFLLGVVCWSGTLVMSAAYCPQRVLRWRNEAVHVISGGVGETILLAGG